MCPAFINIAVQAATANASISTGFLICLLPWMHCPLSLHPTQHRHHRHCHCHHIMAHLEARDMKQNACSVVRSGQAAFSWVRAGTAMAASVAVSPVTIDECRDSLTKYVQMLRSGNGYIDHRYGATSWCYRSHTIILMWSHTMDKCVSAVGTGRTGWTGHSNIQMSLTALCSKPVFLQQVGPIDPKPSLQGLTGKPVFVQLKWNTADFWLAQMDICMSIQVSNYHHPFLFNWLNCHTPRSCLLQKSFKMAN